MACIVNYLTDPKNLIIPGLYLGSLHALSSQQLQGIDTVISLTDRAFLYDLHGMVKIHYVFPVRDSSSDQKNMDRVTQQILPIIKRNLQNNRTVLVHCTAGLHRAATMVVYYLQSIGYTKQQAVKHVQSRRPLALWCKPFRLSYHTHV